LTFTTDGEPAISKNFLDLTVFIQDGRIETKLYRNPVSKSDFYLNFFSAHPTSTINSIPYSLALRVVRNCSLPELQNEALEELRVALVKNSFYPPEIVNEAFQKAKSKPRSDLLKIKSKENEQSDEIGRSVMSTPFHPTLRPLNHILRSCVTAFVKIDDTFDKLVSPPPIVAWNRGPTIKEQIAPSKLSLEKPDPFGTSRCKRKTCVPCNDVIEGNKVGINQRRRQIIGSNDCDSKWVVYMLKCTTCNLHYVGKTFNPFRVRWSNHKSKLKREMENYGRHGGGNFWDLGNNDGDLYLVRHFCEKHLNINSLKWTILHKIGKVLNDPAGNLLKWEHAYIDHFQTIFPGGLNSRE
jgi:hypothetical protein